MVPRRAYIALPDLQVIERPGWSQIITPSFKTGGFNEVSQAVLDEADADAVIDATIASYRDAGIKFRWAVAPDSAPADLAARLEQRGLVRSTSLAMIRDTDLDEPPPPDVTVERVDAANVAEYTQAMAEGWSTDPAPLAAANELVVRSYPTHRLYLARVAGEPAATAAQVMFERSAYLLGAVVLPRFRRRGLYRALVAARLADARASGLALATSHARAETSAPLLVKLGFATVCALDVFSG